MCKIPQDVVCRTYTSPTTYRITHYGLILGVLCSYPYPSIPPTTLGTLNPILEAK